MSQISRKIDWCLKKAEKEIEDCKKEKKSIKHRGLRVIDPDVEEAKKHILKAEHDLDVTRYLLKGDFTDVSMGTIFYSMYQCFLAIGIKFGYETRNQTCTIALMEFLKEEGKIDLDDRFFEYFKYEEEGGEEDSIIEMREDFTYGTEIEVERSKIDFFVEECKELVDVTRTIIFG